MARQPCAGGIVLDDTGRLLMIRRGQAPSQGRWSIPGGRCMPGETSRQACAREVAEETGLQVRVVRAAGSVELAGVGELVYDVDDYLCTPVGGTLRAGDDAEDARWVTAVELAGLDVVPGLLDCLREWGLLPR